MAKKIKYSGIQKPKQIVLAGIFLVIATIVLAQKKITGIVTGADDLPLFGATVAIKNSRIAEFTNENGYFSLAAKKGDVIVVSYVGYASREMSVENFDTLKIFMWVSAVNLDEVIVTGYTSQRRKEITGSIAIVKTKELKAVPAGQIEQTLQGRVAGLNIITSGMPGGKSNVRLHGIGNFGNVTPLYIIDGIQGDINNLNPDDIESLQVLKDAGSYAIYGVRGANGVIIVTTKNGAAGKPTVVYNFYAGYQIPLKNGFSTMSPQENANLVWLRLKNSGELDAEGKPLVPDQIYGGGASPVLPDYIVNNNQGYFEGDPAVDPSKYNLFGPGDLYQIYKTNKTGTDWFHEMFKPAISQNHTITASGGNDKNRYLLSLGYLDQQGTLMNTYLKRYTARINTSYTIKNNLRIGENIQLTYRDNPQIANQQPGYSTFTNFHNYPNEIVAAFKQPTITPIYDIIDYWTSDLGQNGPASNPVARRGFAKDDKGNYWELFGNIYGELNLLKYFTLKSNFGGNQTNYHSYYYQYGAFKRDNPNDATTKNYFNEKDGFYWSWTWTNTLSFAKTFYKYHSIKFLTGTEAIANYNREIGGTSTDYFTNNPDFRTLSAGGSFFSVYSNADQSTLYSILNRFDYGFHEKYYLAATLRRDGSSVFGPLHRYGWFPSVAATWILSNEKFIKNITAISDLRLRTSWGKTGFNGNINSGNQFDIFANHPWASFYDINGTSTSSVQGFTVSQIGGPNTSWQQDIVSDIGLDASLWNGKLIINADVYKKESSGLLFPAALPGILGVGSGIPFGRTPPFINVGNVTNTGLDLMLGSKGSFSKNFSWNYTLTFTTYKNRIVHLNDQSYFFANDFVKNEVGHPIGSFYTYKVIGLFSNQQDVNKSPIQDGAAPGRFKFLDANNDGVISDADRVFIGNPNPTFTLGINIELYYRNFDFSTFMYGSFGNDVWNTFNPHGETKSLLYDSWRPDHKKTLVPIAENYLTFSSYNQEQPSSYFLEHGGYFRNKSLILGYTFSKSFLHKINISNMRVYLLAMNLFTITQYVGLDPELSGDSNAWGIDYGNYPNNQKEYFIGLNVNF